MNELEEKIYNGVELSEREIEQAIYELDVVDENEGGRSRWTTYMTTTIKIKDKFFVIDWERGLTECQMDIFNHQPYEFSYKP